jgi:hypothetical protein
VISQICAAGPVPFFCHDGTDWQDPLNHLLSARALARIVPGRLRVCEGWRREVRARQWPQDAALRWYQRALARDAMLTADRFMAGEASVRQLQRDLWPLAEFYRGPRAWQLARMREKANGHPGLE